MNTQTHTAPSAGTGPRGPFLAVSIQDSEALASTREAFVDFLLAPARNRGGVQPRLSGTGG
ncbi:hypothetical protein HER39_10530 [Arthrobacter deserti]|uniref:Uncharacterized protein n=1 Tax=Arthrobacter deserti TaxID=1742687 RepID=A0ABX1JPN4_9MICC|nr:hypothetical protein [Arthrobacter deserti]